MEFPFTCYVYVMEKPPKLDTVPNRDVKEKYWKNKILENKTENNIKLRFI